MKIEERAKRCVADWWGKGVVSVGDQKLNEVIARHLRDAVAAEREACAKLCESIEEHGRDDHATACAAFIRNRSNTDE